MAEEDLTVRAAIRDELSGPLENIREELARVGQQTDTTGRQAARGARGVDLLGKAGRAAKVGLMAAAGGATALGYAAFRLGKSAVKQASDLNESLNAVNVTYGKQAKAVQKLGRQAATALGLSNVEFNGLSVRFSAFAKTVGGGGKGTVRTLKDLTTRAADFASVMNLEVAESAELFQSGLAGETEPLRKYGIDLSAAKVEAYAYAHGIAKGTESLTEAQKVQARYGSLMEQTAQTQGDFANTSDQLANSQRILGARWDNAQAKLGRGLLPVMTTAVRYLNRDGIPMFLRFSDWFNDEGIPAIGRFVDKARPLAKSVLPAAADALGIIRDAAADAAPHVKALVDGFNGMPGWAKKALVLGGAGAGIGAKLGLGKLAGKGASTVLGAATKAKPVPVWVVNNGPGGPDMPGGGKGRGGRLGGALKTGAAIAGTATGAGAVVAGASILAGAGTAGVMGLQKKVAPKSPLMGTPAGNGWITMDDGKAAAAAKARAAEVQAAYRHTLKSAAAAFKTLPTELQTDIVLHGGPESIADVRKLIREYDLTPDQKNTLFQTLGTAEGIGKVTTYKSVIDGTPRYITTAVTLSGFERAMGQIATLKAGIASVPSAGVDNGAVYLHGGAREKGGPVKAGVPYVVGEKRAELFVPETNGRIIPRLESPAARAAAGGSGGAAVVIERLVIHNPASDLDIEAAVARGIERAERDRLERGA